MKTKYVLDRLTVTDMANSIVKFDEHGDGLARYTIYNYQKNTKGSGYDYKVNKMKSGTKTACSDCHKVLVLLLKEHTNKVFARK